MAARNRASCTDDESLSDHFNLEMVHVNAPQTMTTTTTAHIDPNEQITLAESGGTIGDNDNEPVQYDFLTNPNVIEGMTGEYEIPDLYTYRKVLN